MKDFLKDLSRWLDDPMTGSLLGAIGTLVVLRQLLRVDGAHARIGELEDRVEELERHRAHA